MSALVEQLQGLSGSHWPPRLLAAALAAACALLLARLLWLLLAGPGLAPAPSAPIGDWRAATPRAAIAPWHLFGQTAAVGARAAAPTTALALTLRGTFASPDPENGLAFIADRQGRERAYHTGETILDDAVLIEVHSDHVVLRRAGAREALYLSPGDDAGRSRPGRLPEPKPDPSGGYLSGQLSFGAPDLATARAAQTPALEALAASANLLPVIENGQFIGVRIAAPDPALLARLGLEPDEVVTAVNGIALASPDQRQALEDSLRGDGPLVLTLRRDGRERQLTVRN